jgi:membrane protein
MNSDKFQSIYERINHFLREIPEIILITFKRFDQEQGAEAAASIAYFGVFSLFPLLLFIVSVLGYVLDRFGSPVEIAETITHAIPISGEFIQDNLIQILSVRSLGGIIALIGLLWAGSSVFIYVSRNINRAWPNANTRNFIQYRLVAFGIIFMVLVFMGLWLSSAALSNLIPQFNIPIGEDILIHQTLLWRFLASLTPFLFALIAYFVLYFFIPNTRVRVAESLWGAIVASLSLQFVTRVFAWFLSSGLANFELVYGSLGAGFALITYVYLVGLITILGAHLSAAIACVKRLRKSVGADQNNMDCSKKQAKT